jgi:hypothetical protein
LLLHRITPALRRLQAGGAAGAAGVFFTVNRTVGGRRRAEDVDRVRAVFVDLDGAPLDAVMACDLEPHCVVESSPGRFHAYWLVEDLPLDRFTPLQSTAETKCVAATVQRCIRWRDEKGPARGPSHLVGSRAAVGWRRTWASADGACTTASSCS